MSKFAARVEQLLCTEDPQLYKALQRTLAKKSSGHSRGTRTNSFHHTLKSILLSHIQKMLVGKFPSNVPFLVLNSYLILMAIIDH